MNILTQIGVDAVLKAWYMDDIAKEEDRRLPHHRQPDEAVPLAKLLGTTNSYFHPFMSAFGSSYPQKGKTCSPKWKSHCLIGWHVMM